MKRYRASLCLLFVPLLALLAPAPAVPSAPADGTRYLALTFDDGPGAETAALLDGLRERGAHATFFLIGEQIAGNEALVQRMADEGHQVGNHTFTHARLDRDADTALRELRRTDDALRGLLGDGEYWVRPPWGYISDRTAAALDVPLIYWSVDPEDWRVRDADTVTARLLRDAKDGDILLLHDLYPSSVEAALRTVDALSAQGFVFVTVEELFALRGVTPQPGALVSRVG